MKTQHGQKQKKKKKKRQQKNQNAENKRHGQYNPLIPITLLRSETFLFFFFFNWRIIALQCCADFCWTISRISHNYTHILPIIELALPCLYKIHHLMDVIPFFSGMSFSTISVVNMVIILILEMEMWFNFNFSNEITPISTGRSCNQASTFEVFSDFSQPFP